MLFSFTAFDFLLPSNNTMSNKHTHAQTWIARKTEKGRDCDPVECYCTDDVRFLFAHLKIHLYFSQMFCTFCQWRAPHTLITKHVDLSISRNGKKNYEFQNKWDLKITPTDRTELKWMKEREREREKHETPFSNDVVICVIFCFYFCCWCDVFIWCCRDGLSLSLFHYILSFILARFCNLI